MSHTSHIRICLKIFFGGIKNEKKNKLTYWKHTAFLNDIGYVNPLKVC
jgi:hypothetical protein